VGGRQIFYRGSLLSALRGEFGLDLGAEGAGDFFERRQRHPIVISPSRRAMLGCCMPTRRASSAWVQAFFKLARNSSGSRAWGPVFESI